MMTRDELSTTLRQLAENKGISQKQCAAEIGVPYGTFLAWVGKRGYPRAEAMAKVERYFELNNIAVRDKEVKLEDVFALNNVTLDGELLTPEDKSRILATIRLYRPVAI